VPQRSSSEVDQLSDFPEIGCGIAIAPVHGDDRPTRRIALGAGALKMVEAVRDHWLIVLAFVVVVGIIAWLMATRR